jgi:hypothetical protein
MVIIGISFAAAGIADHLLLTKLLPIPGEDEPAQIGAAFEASGIGTDRDPEERRREKAVHGSPVDGGRSGSFGRVLRSDGQAKNGRAKRPRITSRTRASIADT